MRQPDILRSEYEVLDVNGSALDWFDSEGRSDRLRTR
jgi:hypothetical protein